MTDAPHEADAVFLFKGMVIDDDPVSVLDRWLFEAKNKIGPLTNAMSLATATPDGDPDVRIVLLQSLHEGSLVFFTNLASSKGKQLLANPKAAACFHWPALGRQVRVRGGVHRVDERYADQYFASRSRGSQIGAHASPQSSAIRDRDQLIEMVADVEGRLAGQTVPRPAHWTGLVLAPIEIEFWEEGADRLHDRLLFTRAPESTGWSTTRLAP